MQKYYLLRERVQAELPEVKLDEAPVAADSELARVHAADYIERVATGALDAREQREIGFPWSPEMVERARRSVGATIAACHAARQGGFAVNLAGGTHHSYASHGAGFCVFNDAAVAARALQAEALQREECTPYIAVVDLDVHQGNGTAAIFQDDPSVFTLSLHGTSNYPFKEISDLDVAYPTVAVTTPMRKRCPERYRRCSSALNPPCLSIWQALIRTSKIAWGDLR